jgi:hypothetical protein
MVYYVFAKEAQQAAVPIGEEQKQQGKGVFTPN